mgnify:CR=1 FL=1
MSAQIKICGLKTPDMVEAAIQAKASYAGFVFFEKSPRHIDMSSAHELAKQCRYAGLWSVALTVDPTDAHLDEIITRVEPDMIQLHGGESPERVAEIAARCRRPIMKALAISDAHDFAQVGVYEEVADLLLFDAKPPKSMSKALPGGNGLAFDWSLIKGRTPQKPWMLSGGLTPENVAQAIGATGAKMVDVSSGVESAPGKKEAELIAAFCAASKTAEETKI